MALYFFHLTDGRLLVRDLRGMELADLDAAKEHARQACARHVLDVVHRARPFPADAAIEICDGKGRVLHLEWCWFLIRAPARFGEMTHVHAV